MQVHKHHNLGNEYYKKEEFDKALEEYNKAIEVKPDSLETYFNRALAYTRKKEYDKAISDINKVIKLNPTLAEAYYTSGLIHEYLKDEDGALADYDKALSCDSGYDKASRQRDLIYIRVIRLRAEDYKLLDYLQEHFSKIEDETAKSVVGIVKEELEKMKAIIDRPSCSLDCGSICCHFKEDPWNNGVFIEPEKIERIKEFLKERGKNPDDFMGKVKWSALSKEQKGGVIKKEPYKFAEDGKYVMYSPRLDHGKKLPEYCSKNAPLSLNIDEVDWVSGDSHPCMFIGKKGCMIHDVEGGFEVCRQWVCLTGYIVVLLRYLNVLTQDDIDGLPLDELNKIASSGLRLLYELYGDKDLRALGKEKEKLLKSVVDGTIDDIGNYRRVSEDFDKKFDSIITQLRKDIKSS